MRKKGDSDNQKYLIFRVYFHRTLDKSICDYFASLPPTIRAAIVKEAVKSYFRKDGGMHESICVPFTTEEPDSSLQFAKVRFTDTLEGISLS